MTAKVYAVPMDVHGSQAHQFDPGRPVVDDRQSDIPVGLAE
jgi:hypothetical protein